MTNQTTRNGHWLTHFTDYNTSQKRTNTSSCKLRVTLFCKKCPGRWAVRINACWIYKKTHITCAKIPPTNSLSNVLLKLLFINTWEKKKSSVSGCNKSGIIETLELHIITKRNNRNNNRLLYTLNNQLLDTMAHTDAMKVRRCIN